MFYNLPACAVLDTREYLRGKKISRKRTNFQLYSTGATLDIVKMQLLLTKHLNLKID